MKVRAAQDSWGQVSALGNATQVPPGCCMFPPLADNTNPPDCTLPCSEREVGEQQGVLFVRNTTEEELGWHNKEEKDQTPEPLRFMPARVPGPALDTICTMLPLDKKGSKGWEGEMRRSDVRGGLEIQRGNHSKIKTY
ncbi:hypothetical protein F7725_002747 [Dissostichus mawsoni]|uniref:Uncharacterized protein n=1 Tax=Dissostichus mawsoni TaxID=36200 RepID=A0A7J5YA78_DISMA|nr:hypothetical protein F7725_002747 [Dissostichus mawsoni]